MAGITGVGHSWMTDAQWLVWVHALRAMADRMAEEGGIEL